MLFLNYHFLAPCIHLNSLLRMTGTQSLLTPSQPVQHTSAFHTGCWNTLHSCLPTLQLPPDTCHCIAPNSSLADKHTKN